MNKTLVYIGGVAVTIGLGLYLFTKNNDNGNGSVPPPPDCQGQCYYENYIDCDKNHNLCKCIDGQWQLLEENSPLCYSPTQHNECFKTIGSNIMVCLPVVGVGTDLCDNIGFSGGCSCSDGLCDTFHSCEPYDNVCLRNAVGGINVNAIPSNMICWDESIWNYCYYQFEEPVIAQMLTGTLWYKWGGGLSNFGIWATYKNRANLIYERQDWFTGESGSFDINQNFPQGEQGLDGLVFGCDGYFSNIHIDKFVGKIIY